MLARDRALAGRRKGSSAFSYAGIELSELAYGCAWTDGQVLLLFF